MPLSDYTYSSRASFAYVLCTTSSAVDAITTSALPVFDSDHDDVVFTNNVSSDITYTANAGTFTFAKAGTYHVVLTLVTSQETADKVQTTLFQLNSAAANYLAAPFIDFAMDPTETTHQRVITIAAGDVLHIKTKTAGNSMGIVKGTSLVITEITSGVFASSTVTTAGSNNTTSAFNPLDTDGDGPAFASTGKVASGITFTEAGGSMTVPTSGKYLIMINNIYEAGGGTNSSITALLVKTPAGGSDATLLSNSMKLHSSIDPLEHTMCIIEDLNADDALKVTYNIASGRVQAAKGMTFTVIKLQEGQPIDGTGRGVGGYGTAYISVASDQDTTAGATEINPFQSGNLTGDKTFTTKTSSGILYLSLFGMFTVNEPGLYFIMHNPILDAAADVVVTTKIFLNAGGPTGAPDGVIASSSDTALISHGVGDPANLTNTALLELQRGDIIQIFTDANTAVNLTHKAGSHVCIFKYYGFFELSDKSAVTDGLIADDLTINTFSQGNLSEQFERNVEQVPFKFGIRGPGTLRGRKTNPSVVKGGDKKS